MRLINARTVIGNVKSRNEILEDIEIAGRVCYKSEGKITEDSAAKFVQGLIKSGHESVLEHESISVRFICDRGVSHELVRHRIASFSQESTRYCNYGKDGQLTFIIPCFLPIKANNNVFSAFGERQHVAKVWIEAMLKAEDAYLSMIARGCSPQEARAVLPNSIKTELVMTQNLRQWRHFFNLRALNKTGKAHPQMLSLTRPLLDKFKLYLPEVFGDL